MKKRRYGVLALNSPYVLWSAIFIIVPLFIVGYYSFVDANGNFSVDNFIEIFKRKDYLNPMLRALWYSVVATVIALLISYPFAYFLSKQCGMSQKIQMALIMVPMLTNLVIRTYSWANILEYNGLINKFLGLFGIEPLTMMGTSGAVIFGMVYNYLPYMILPIYTVMSKIDPSLLEAAEDLGCNGWNKLRRVIIPLSLPGVISGITMVFVPSISTFYISQKLSDEKLIGDVIYNEMQEYHNFNMGASLSFVLMVFIFASMLIMNKLSDEDGGVVL
ncbi:MAG: ABC transporter permease [Ruminococcaceae bacterium]|nr:ABC transporter permease [Oscillospiraceae bacterium]